MSPKFFTPCYPRFHFQEIWITTLANLMPNINHLTANIITTQRPLSEEWPLSIPKQLTMYQEISGVLQWSGIRVRDSREASAIKYISSIHLFVTVNQPVETQPPWTIKKEPVRPRLISRGLGKPKLNDRWNLLFGPSTTWFKTPKCRSDQPDFWF